MTSTGATLKFLTNQNSILEQNSELVCNQTNHIEAGWLFAVGTDDCDWLVITYKYVVDKSSPAH